MKGLAAAVLPACMAAHALALTTGWARIRNARNVCSKTFGMGRILPQLTINVWGEHDPGLKRGSNCEAQTSTRHVIRTLRQLKRRVVTNLRRP